MLRKLSLLVLAGLSTSALSDSLSSALTGGDVYGNLNLRYESVDQDNALQDASALTLRTRLGYKTKAVNGFSFTVEMEDSRIVLGQSDFSVPPTGFQTGEYSVIADPETTELDQGFIQYKNDALTLKLGRQVITHDGHRFVGHVGWRQDRQTFDGATVIYAPNDKFRAEYNYLTQRNRIFAQAQDLDAKDHLLNLSYKTSVGKLTAYSYLLEVDEGTDNALDTYGFSFKGATKGDTKFLYHAEYAKQSNESGGSDFDTDYLFLEGGVTTSGITAKLGYEVLGSDDGQVGFQTPLATLHKFNGWSDQFLGTPGQGLVDTYVSVAGKVAGGSWLAAYHTFSADESTEGADDFGSEINLQYVKPISKKTKFGIKYASYSADDIKVDADKLWAWVSVSF
jgi:hypothetical protein